VFAKGKVPQRPIRLEELCRLEGQIGKTHQTRSQERSHYVDVGSSVVHLGETGRCAMKRDGGSTAQIMGFLRAAKKEQNSTAGRMRYSKKHV
jgi:hypothetical protein